MLTSAATANDYFVALNKAQLAKLLEASGKSTQILMRLGGFVVGIALAFFF